MKHGKQGANGTALGCLDLVKMYGEKNKRTEQKAWLNK